MQAHRCISPPHQMLLLLVEWALDLLSCPSVLPNCAPTDLLLVNTHHFYAHLAARASGSLVISSPLVRCGFDDCPRVPLNRSEVHGAVRDLLSPLVSDAMPMGAGEASDGGGMIIRVRAPQHSSDPRR